MLVNLHARVFLCICVSKSWVCANVFVHVAHYHMQSLGLGLRANLAHAGSRSKLHNVLGRQCDSSVAGCVQKWMGPCPYQHLAC